MAPGARAERTAGRAAGWCDDAGVGGAAAAAAAAAAAEGIQPPGDVAADPVRNPGGPADGAAFISPDDVATALWRLYEEAPGGEGWRVELRARAGVEEVE